MAEILSRPQWVELVGAISSVVRAIITMPAIQERSPGVTDVFWVVLSVTMM